MRAAFIAAPEEIAVSVVPTPDPGPGEVLIELEGCGVCGSDLPLWQGRPWFEYPREPGAPGHEGWGRIVALGDGVAAARLGVRVAAISFHANAEFDVASADDVVILPEALDGQPFPGEALGCAMNIAQRCDFRQGETVVVVGIGFIGALLVQLAARAGARVVAIARRPFARDMALRMGADHAWPIDDAALERIQQATGGALCDCVIEATGTQEALDLCSELARVRGRLVIAGFHQDGRRQIDMQLWNWRGLDVINAHERDPAIYVRGVRAAADAIADGALDPSPLYTHEFELGRIADAFTTASGRPEGFLKALVRL